MENGSSPRLWGTHTSEMATGGEQRFIPTPVGNTGHLARSEAAIAVHPHACGEHCSAPIDRLHNSGSSPRLWGTLAHPRRLGVQARFIPTPVGNTNIFAPPSRGHAVHPHACGEHTL
ncbi:hypothetical protein D1AOALGA4SA_11483 [Olavius algarvensis Delta 1 endosymbiont]|nr:hypothetical protein D1AOALGA4SA_11483 [Olavius algarvensis Delta 1 endosymbiont]